MGEGPAAGVVDDGEQALALALEAFGRYDVDAMVAHLSTAIRAFSATGDRRRGAIAAARLGDVYANALGNPTASRAWITRAQRLLADEPPCVEQGWVAVAAMGCDVDDPDELLAHSELALDRARRFGDINLETKALADGGLAHVQAGRVAEGMAMLDEAMALACGPADDRDTAAKSVCSFFTACYYAADFDRAGTWADALRSHGLISIAPGNSVFLSSHCDSVQATLLMELGRWGEAEALLQRAQAEFAAAMPVPNWHADIALADLRVRQGRFTDAEALLLGKEQWMQALLPAARLHLARGDHAMARAICTRALRVLGPDRLRAVEVLTVLVDAELASGDLDAATDVCARLAELNRGLDVPALAARAAAARARALGAGDDIPRAIEVLEVALDGLERAQLPYVRATTRLELARWRERGGHRAAAALDAAAVVAELEALDVVLLPDDEQLLARLVADRPVSADLAPTGRASGAVLRRDGRWWELAWGGTSVRLPDTKGLRYLAVLVERPGVERHSLDLVDRVEGVATAGAGIDRRAIGDAGPLLDTEARTAYRHRIEELRSEIDEAVEEGRFDAAEATQQELDQLVQQLSQAFGLGGRERTAGSAAEKARLNVTRALRAAIVKVREAVPDAGAVLDQGVRTGLYCTYDPPAGSPRWTVEM